MTQLDKNFNNIIQVLAHVHRFNLNEATDLLINNKFIPNTNMPKDDESEINWTINQTSMIYKSIYALSIVYKFDYEHATELLFGMDFLTHKYDQNKKQRIF